MCSCLHFCQINGIKNWFNYRDVQAENLDPGVMTRETVDDVILVQVWRRMVFWMQTHCFTAGITSFLRNSCYLTKTTITFIFMLIYVTEKSKSWMLHFMEVHILSWQGVTNKKTNTVLMWPFGDINCIFKRFTLTPSKNKQTNKKPLQTATSVASETWNLWSWHTDQ